MYSIEEVKELEGKSNSALSEMRKLTAALTAKIDAIRTDGSRSEAFKAEKIQAERDAAMPAIRVQSEIIAAVNKELHPQERFWDSKPLVLSMQKFSEAPSQDAMIRQNTGRELSVVPEGVLALHIDAAIEDRNLPMIYQCWLAASSRTDTAKLEINLDLAEIPEQKAALSAIAQAFVNVKNAEFCMIDAVGARFTPIQRLEAINQRDGAVRRVGV